jgi:esterase/lipase superfamily enzyme
MDDGFLHDVFMLYAGEREWHIARLLSRALVKLGVRAWQDLPLFRNEGTAWPAGMTDQLRERLRSSRYLLVLVSPASAHSARVGEVLRQWFEWDRQGRLVPVLVEGELGLLFPDLASLWSVDVRGAFDEAGRVVAREQFADGVRVTAVRILGRNVSEPAFQNIMVAEHPGMARRQKTGTSAGGGVADGTSVLVRVLYGTDRAVTGKTDPGKFYANDRDASSDPVVSLGVCDVSIPASEKHRIGRLERPSVWKLEFSADVVKHVILRSVLPLEQDEFFKSLSDRVSSSSRREALVFVHGYNVSFHDAARRTAQMAYDIGFAGAPILYSWPSRGHWWLYPADETLVEWSVPHLEWFLANVALLSGARKIHLIAHSMGNRALTKALELLVAKKTVRRSLFRHIVLTAPDLDAQTFVQLARVIAPVGERLTMYANYRDRALLLSKLFHVYQRAGSSIVIVRGMDTIDASRVDTSLTRHSYFGSSRTVLADLSSLLLDGRPPRRRFGMWEKQNAQGKYYLFRP